MTSGDDGPDSIPDFLLLAGTVAVIIPFLVANGVVYRHRHRKYFQASGWELILGSSVAGIIWILSAFIVNEHFSRDAFKFFSYCALWTFWFQLTLGICLWLTFMALRLHHLLVYCTTGKPPCSARVWGLYIPAMLAPAIIFALIATVKKISIHPCEIEKRCVILHASWKLSSFFVLPPLYFSIILTLLYRLRNQKDYLLRTQSQHTVDYVAMAFVLYLLTGTTYWSNRQNNVEGRCFLTFSVCSIVFVHFWVHTGWPVYLCLFKGGEEMDKYEESLRRHGAHCLQGRQNSSDPRVDANGTVIPWTFSLGGEEAIFQAIAAEQTKKEELKMKKEQLHQRINLLRNQIEELKHQNTVAIPHCFSRSFPRIMNTEKVLPDSGQVTRHLSLEHCALARISNSSHFLQSVHCN